MAKQLIAHATIKDKRTDWSEPFNVDSKETAEEFIKTVIEEFNDTLKHGETKRTFVRINSFEEKEEPRYDSLKMDDPDDWDDEEFWDDQEEERQYLNERF